MSKKQNGKKDTFRRREASRKQFSAMPNCGLSETMTFPGHKAGKPPRLTRGDQLVSLSVELRKTQEKTKRGSQSAKAAAQRKCRTLRAGIEKLDKEEVAIHEAGHLTVVNATGFFGDTWLTKSGTSDYLNNRSWVGRHRCFLGFTPQIAVAGIVAECFAEDEEIEAWQICERLELDMPSPSDLELFPPDDELESTIDEVLALLKKHRKFFDWAVAELLKHEQIPSDVAQIMFGSLIS